MVNYTMKREELQNGDYKTNNNDVFDLNLTLKTKADTGTPILPFAKRERERERLVMVMRMVLLTIKDG